MIDLGDVKQISGTGNHGGYPHRLAGRVRCRRLEGRHQLVVCATLFRRERAFVELHALSPSASYNHAP